MHALSRRLAVIEGNVLLVQAPAMFPPTFLDRLKSAIGLAPPEERETLSGVHQALGKAAENKDAILDEHEEYLAQLRQIRTMIEGLEEV